MGNNTFDIFFGKTTDLIDVYQLFDNINEDLDNTINIILLDIYSFSFLPKSVRKYLDVKEFNILLIYLSDDGYPCLTIDKTFFADLLEPLFIQNITFNYYLVDGTVPIFRLIEYNSNGEKTGSYVDI